MKQVILNEQRLTGLTVYETAPIGMPMIWLTDKAPVGFLFFDGKEYNKSDFPELYEVVKNIPSFHSETEGKFKIPNLKDRVLQGADTVIGQLIEAGLPNITGEAWGGQGVFQNGAGNNGALSVTRYTSNTSYWNSGAVNYQGISINAKNGETKTDGTLKTADEPHVFGNSDTVQPSAFTVRYIIKATNYIDLPKNAIDDTKTTNANAWSAEQVNNALTNWTKLSDYEPFQITTENKVVEYDGFITLSGWSINNAQTYYVNDVAIGKHNSSDSQNIGPIVIIVNKGDRVRYSGGRYAPDNCFARWYKLRSY